MMIEHRTLHTGYAGALFLVRCPLCREEFPAAVGTEINPFLTTDWESVALFCPSCCPESNKAQRVVQDAKSAMYDANLQYQAAHG